MIKVIFTLLFTFTFILLTNSIADENNKAIEKQKYLNFTFDYVPKETNKGNIDISKDTYKTILNIINRKFGIKNSQELFMIGVTYSPSANVFLVSGVMKYEIIQNNYITTDGISIKEKLSNCKYTEGESSGPLPCSDQHFWSVIDIASGSFNRIPEKIVLNEHSPEVGFAYIPLGVTYNKLVYYGCYVSYRFGKVDLDLDEGYELVAFSGNGAEDFGMSPAPEHANATLYFSIYSLNDTRKPLFHYHLVTNNMDYIQGIGSRDYTKFYFVDYDENGKLDIIAWTRKFNVSYVNNVGFKEKYINDDHRIFEEASPSFVEKKLTKNKISVIVNAQELKWKDGFPSKNICKDPPFNTFDILPNGEIQH